MLTPDFAKPEDTRALRRLHGGPDRADRRQVRRLAEGRARHRGQHGAVRRARVGREGDRADAPGQAARRSRRRARARGGDQRRPRRPPAQPEDDAGDRGGGRHLRRVRVLRAGLPEPPPDHDAAPADRAAPRDGAPGARARRCSRRCSREYEYDALETCAADGTCLLACPVGIDTGKFVKALRARQHTRPGARRSRCGSPGAGSRSSAPPAAGLARRRPRPGRARGAARRQPRRPPRRSATSWSPSGRANMPRPAPATLPATTAGRRRGRLPAGLRQPDLRPRAQRGTGGPGLPEALVAVSARAGHAASGSRPTSPATAARRRGPRRASATAPGGWPTTPSTRCGAGATAASCRSSATPARARSGSPRRRCRCSARSTPSATRGCGSSTRSPGRGELLPQLRDRRASSRSVAVHPPCATRHLELDGDAARDRRRARRRGRRPARRHLLRLRRRPRHAPPRAARRRRPPTRRPSSAAAASTPTCAPTAPARSASSRAPAAPTRASCSRSRS